MKRTRAGFGLAALALLSACSLYPSEAPALRLFDFGPPHVGTYRGPNLPPLTFAGVEASAGVESSGIHYRLLYRDPHELRRFPGALWLAPPARLLAARLRTRIDALSRPGTPRYVLILDLTAWEVDFTSPTSGLDRVSLDATLTRPLEKDWRARQVFSFSKKAGPRVPGVVAGFASLDRRLNRALTVWIAHETGSGTARRSTGNMMQRP